MDLLLSAKEIRILGCLLEKEMATPDYYPLSLNGLINACNQKTNRSPVVNYDEQCTLEAIATLKENGLAYQSDSGRVPKFAENFIKSFNLVNKEAAILCVLMVRGPQTIGELRNRTERLHDFEDLSAVEKTLTDLQEMDFITKLSRQPGCKEARFTHLLAGEPTINPAPQPANESISLPDKSPTARITELENDLADLRREFEALKEELGS